MNDRLYNMNEGNIEEHKLSYDIALDQLETKKEKSEKVKCEEKDSVITLTCTCGNNYTFIKESSFIDICGDCFDKFDNLSHYLITKRRNKNRG